MDEQPAAHFARYCLDRMISARLPGLAFALITNGAVHRRALGFRDLGRRRPTTPRTLFGIGSVTKVFTAIAIMQLRDRGLLRLDDPVAGYVPLSIEPFGEPITIGHFLSHSSGIPALGLAESRHADRWFMTGLPIADEQDLLAFMEGAGDWVHFRPGERWFYLNEGYLLLGAVIERLSGQRYATYVTEHILTPLGMNRSYFAREQVEADDDRAVPYVLDRDGKFFVGTNLYSLMPASGGLVSNVEDMTRFVQLFLNEGQSEDGHPIISRESLRLMTQPRVALPYDAREGLSASRAGEAPTTPVARAWHGNGLQVSHDFFGHDLAGHTGGVMGAAAYMGFVPAEQVGVILLTNGQSHPMDHLGMVALALQMGQDPEQLDFIRRDRLLDALCGPYRGFRGTMEAEVARNGDLLELTIRYHYEDRIVPLILTEFDDRRPRFTAMSGGRRLSAEFIRSGDRVELVFERYQFRKV